MTRIRVRLISVAKPRRAAPSPSSMELLPRRSPVIATWRFVRAVFWFKATTTKTYPTISNRARRTVARGAWWCTPRSKMVRRARSAHRPGFAVPGNASSNAVRKNHAMMETRAPKIRAMPAVASVSFQISMVCPRRASRPSWAIASSAFVSMGPTRKSMTTPISPMMTIPVPPIAARWARRRLHRALAGSPVCRVGCLASAMRQAFVNNASKLPIAQCSLRTTGAGLERASTTFADKPSKQWGWLLLH